MALDHLESVKDMKIVSGAKHLIEEPGELIEVADLAIEWYKWYSITRDQ